MLKTTVNVKHSYNHCNMDSCKSFAVFTCTQKQILKYNTEPVQIDLWMLSSWLCYHIKLPDSQLPSKALTYFNATIVSMVKDRI